MPIQLKRLRLSTRVPEKSEIPSSGLRGSFSSAGSQVTPRWGWGEVGTCYDHWPHVFRAQRSLVGLESDIPALALRVSSYVPLQTQ